MGAAASTIPVIPAAAAPAAPAASDAAKAPAPALFQRIALLGASLTAGFDLSEPFGGPKSQDFRFSRFVEAAVPGAHERFATNANALIFVQPVNMMDKQITATLATKPSLVLGLDALFWFCYGHAPTEAQRLTRFESGLKLMERIDAPLIVGDIPDGSKAVGGILEKGQMPQQATIAKCNARLASWAQGRKNVTVFPISKLMAAINANDEFKYGGVVWEKGKTLALLRDDSLHPSTHGLALLAVTVLNGAATSANPPLPAESVNHDPNAVFTAASAAPAK